MKTVSLKVFVPLTYDGAEGWIFDFVCPGYALSVSFERLLLLRNATVNWNLGIDMVCRDKYVEIAYNNYPKHFEINESSKKMVPKKGFSGQPHPSVGPEPVSREWEVQDKFFTSNNIIPKWNHGGQDWGRQNATTGKWSGMVGMIEKDEVDYALCCFSGTYPRSQIAFFSPGIYYFPSHWLTRYPQELSPTWNLLRLFTKGCEL